MARGKIIQQLQMVAEDCNGLAASARRHADRSASSAAASIGAALRAGIERRTLRHGDQEAQPHRNRRLRLAITHICEVQRGCAERTGGDALSSTEARWLRQHHHAVADQGRVPLVTLRRLHPSRRLGGKHPACPVRRGRARTTAVRISHVIVHTEMTFARTGYDATAARKLQERRSAAGQGGPPPPAPAVAPCASQAPLEARCRAATTAWCSALSSSRGRCTKVSVVYARRHLT